MTYAQYQQLKPEDFKRLCGVHHQTFTRMVSVLEEQVEQKKLKPGKPSKLSIVDQVFVSLEYWREYRTNTSRLRNPTWLLLTQVQGF